MVRHVRFVWDHTGPFPDELVSRGWDCDDPGVDDEEFPGRRRRSRKTASGRSASLRCVRGSRNGRRDQS